MVTVRRRVPAAIAIILLCLAGCSGSVQVNDSMLANEANGAHWPGYGRTFSGNHFSPLAQINVGNVSQLGLAWSYPIDTPLRADSQPLAVDGIIYIATGPSVVQAIEASTGRMIWRYDPQLLQSMDFRKHLPSWGIRGLALWKNKLIVGLQDGRLIGLDRKTGTLVWSVQTLDEKVDKYGEATITGAPRVFNGKVVIGFGGAERWARGAVSAFDAESGKFLWRFFVVPGNPQDGFEDAAMEMAARTWSGEWWKFGGGGTVWNSIVYDPDFDRIYLGTGNGGPWNWKVRNPEGLDALFLASIVALDAKTGKYVWHYQQNPNEAWDYNATMDIELATIAIDGRPRKVLMQAPKNGYFYVIDRETGRLISANNIAPVSWSTGIDMVSGRPIDVPGNRYENGPIVQWPGMLGAHNWQPMSYSPKSGLVYIPTIHQGNVYSSEGIAPRTWMPTPNSWNTAMGESGALTIDPEQFGSYLQAWDPVNQKVRWKISTPGIVNGGTMATAGGLVFQGHLDGSFNGYDAESGRNLWAFPAGVPVAGAPISFLAKGEQYVAVLSAPPWGPGAVGFAEQTRFGWRYRDHPKRLLVFKLGGQAELPPTAPPGPVVVLKDSGFKPDAVKASAGLASFVPYCAVCHGIGAVSAGGAPDLRASPIPLNAAAFEMIVRKGGLQVRGMPGITVLTDEELLNMRHYIRQQADVAGEKSATSVPESRGQQ